MRLRYTPESMADLQGIRQYIHDTLRNPNAAKRISKMILDNCAQLKSFPEMGMELSALIECETNLRMLVCEHYVAIYRRDHDVISVARIFNGRQDFLRILFGSNIFDRTDQVPTEQ